MSERSFSCRAASLVGLLATGACLVFPGALAAPLKQDIVIFRDPEKYAAFPNVYYDGDQHIWVTFGWNTTRSHYGRLAGGKAGGYRFFSPDMGKTWIRNDRPGYHDIPWPLRSLVLSDGTMVRVGMRGWEEVKPDQLEKLRAQGIVIRKLKDKFIACYRVYVAISHDRGRTWQTRYLSFPDRAPLLHGGPAKAIRLRDDTILCPLYGYRKSNETEPCAWVLRSTDRGQSWQLIEAAYDGVHGFSEWGIVETRKPGRVVGLIRTQGMKGASAPEWETGFLYEVISDDGGRTWSKPRRTALWGYPATLIRCRDGAILASYGYRRPPYGIRACFSYDDGRTWDWKREVILRWDALPDGPRPGVSIGDLGYPRSVELRDGTIFTVYYITLGDGVTHIAATRWSRDYIGPPGLKRGQDAVPKPDPSLPPRNMVDRGIPVRLKYALLQSFIPTERQVAAVAVRVDEESRGHEHTYGLFCVIRKPEGGIWWTKSMGNSETLKPDEVKIGGWNVFRFRPPVKVTPGETYVLTVYNADYIPNPIRLRPGLRGDHFWYLTANIEGYPNGSLYGHYGLDLGFVVYSKVPPGPPRGDTEGRESVEQ